MSTGPETMEHMRLKHVWLENNLLTNRFSGERIVEGLDAYATDVISMHCIIINCMVIFVDMDVYMYNMFEYAELIIDF